LGRQADRITGPQLYGIWCRDQSYNERTTGTVAVGTGKPMDMELLPACRENICGCKAWGQTRVSV